MICLEADEATMKMKRNEYEFFLVKADKKMKSIKMVNIGKWKYLRELKLYKKKVSIVR